MQVDKDEQVGDRSGLGTEAVVLPEPAGFRTRYRSEPGMIGHYPWTYADQRRRRVDRPEHETEDLYTADQVRALLAAERERRAHLAGELQALRNHVAHWQRGGIDAAALSRAESALREWA